MPFLCSGDFRNAAEAARASQSCVGPLSASCAVSAPSKQLTELAADISIRHTARLGAFKAVYNRSAYRAQSDVGGACRSRHQPAQRSKMHGLFLA
jgi:hypothetical protein